MTNPLHYPDLERCRKLTYIGFPETEMGIAINYAYSDKVPTISRWQNHDEVANCPSVMEMLDVTPMADISKDSNGCMVWITECDNEVPNKKTYTQKEFEGNLPNALADLILWLHDNKYITFNK